jgi:hypothetical protein
MITTHLFLIDQLISLLIILQKLAKNVTSPLLYPHRKVLMKMYSLPAIEHKNSHALIIDLSNKNSSQKESGVWLLEKSISV